MLKKIFIAIVMPLTLVIGMFAIISGGHDYLESSQGSDSDTVTLMDIIIGGHSITEDFEGPDYDDWLPDAQEEVQEMRSSDLFVDENDETASISETAKQSNPVLDLFFTTVNATDDEDKLDDWKAAASVVLYTQWVTRHTTTDSDGNTISKHSSLIPDGKKNTDGNWDTYINCFKDTKLKTKKVTATVTSNINSLFFTGVHADDNDSKENGVLYYIEADDPCWKNLEDAYGISISKTLKTNVNSVATQVKKYTQRVGALFEESTFGENWFNGKPKADEVWNRVYKEAPGNFQTYSQSNPQCTDIAHWRFWTTYGKDWSGGGNGNRCAANVVNTYGDASHTTPNGYYFTLESKPSGGSVFSWGSGTYGHTGFIEKVEGEYLWYSDGNYNAGSIVKGVHINYKVKITDFLNGGYMCNGTGQFAVPHKA